MKFEGGKAVVYVQTGDKDANTFERRVVQTGLSDGVNIEIRSGLRIGEKVRGNENQRTALISRLLWKLLYTLFAFLLGL